MSKSDDVYYYVYIDQPFNILKTYVLDEYINLIFENKIQPISDNQRKELGLDDKYFLKISKMISKNYNKIPLYDIRSDHIFPIYWENVYNRIFYENYRFIDVNFYRDLQRIKNKTESNVENLRILSYYHIPTLQKTYYQVFYNSFVIDSYITNCKRPSYHYALPHINPYYNMDEINYLAYDWDISKDVVIDYNNLEKLCEKISKYDVSFQTLLNHQLYIYNSNAFGLVKHYSLFGSYFMNLYLRKNECCLPNPPNDKDIVRNLYLENQINIMMKLINGAPSFDKDYTVYRFVTNDNYLLSLSVGDVYQDPGFTSTTRNPFYYNKNYAFGNILIKIKLPKNIKGVGLCIESYSNFPNEEEIILPPASKYRLDAIITGNTQQYDNFSLIVQKKYEFTWIDNSYLNKEPTISITNGYFPKIPLIDLKNIFFHQNINQNSIIDRLSFFKENYTCLNNQFKSTILDQTYTFVIESYDSTSIYKNFFYYETANGVMITTSNHKCGNINLFMEIGSDIHINYYFRYSITDPTTVINLDNKEWVEWLSMLSYVLGCKNVVIHSNYTLNYEKSDSDQVKIMKTRHTFSQNIYLYMKYGKKLFKFNEIDEKFDYYQIDYLKQIKINDIIRSSDKNELFRISKTTQITNIYDFYLYIVENYPQFVQVMESKIGEIYTDDSKNPFLNTFYQLRAWDYLLDKNYIDVIPPEREFMKKGSFKQIVGDKKIVKFKNRLRNAI